MRYELLARLRSNGVSASTSRRRVARRSEAARQRLLSGVDRGHRFESRPGPSPPRKPPLDTLRDLLAYDCWVEQEAFLGVISRGSGPASRQEGPSGLGSGFP